MGGGSFKSGAGSLDFEEDAESDAVAGDADSFTDGSPEQEVTASRESTGETQSTDEESEQSDAGDSGGVASGSKYPYFVRRNAVGDERSNRLEVHVRDEVAASESAFLSALADELDTDRVAKTDAREFALKLAHDRPDAVARLMREEGYGELG